MNIAIGADHRGTSASEDLIRRLGKLGHGVVERHCGDGGPCDYPEAAYVIGNAVASGAADLGILLCGSGIGMCMAANKIDGVRAALVGNTISAEMSRRHNNANVLCLSADTLNDKSIAQIVEAWLEAEFEGGRHARRVNKIEAIERGEDPRELSA